MSAEEPLSHDCQSRADKILECAVTIFARDGFAQADVQKIADAAEVGKGTIYRHFGNKEALFLAATRYLRNQMLDEADCQACAHTAPLEKLLAAMTSVIDFFYRRPEIVELLIQERAHFRERTSTFFDDADGRNAKWDDIFRQLIADGVIRDLPILQIHAALSRFVFGAMFVKYLSGSRPPSDQERSDMFQILFHGLLAPDQSRTP